MKRAAIVALACLLASAAHAQVTPSRDGGKPSPHAAARGAGTTGRPMCMPGMATAMSPQMHKTTYQIMMPHTDKLMAQSAKCNGAGARRP